MELPHDLAIPLLNIYPKGMKSGSGKDTCTLQHYVHYSITFTTEIRNNLNVYEEIDKDVIHMCVCIYIQNMCIFRIYMYIYMYMYICIYICICVYIFRIYIWNPWWLSSKELTFKAGDCLQLRWHEFDLWVSIKKTPGEGNGNPL